MSKRDPGRVLEAFEVGILEVMEAVLVETVRARIGLAGDLDCLQLLGRLLTGCAVPE